MFRKIANVPIPIDCFLHTLIKVHGKQRWKDSKGRFYEWDHLHGHIEKYNSRGYHIAILDEHGNNIGTAINRRKIQL